VAGVAIAVLGLLLAGVYGLQGRAPAPPSPPAYWPTALWRTATPEDHGFHSDRLAAALLTIREKNIRVHSLLVIRNGYVFVEATFYPYDGTTAHDVASVTKSVMTTLIGIAADQGTLRLDQPMLSFFGDRSIANRDAVKEQITVRHLANMSSGLDCTPERDEATLKEMWTAPDWVQFVLDRPVTWQPGTRFVYCSPGTHLLSAILQRATGMTALEFARQNLFAPLGISNVIWPADPGGVTRGWGDIRLHPRDMAKIGFLWRNRGTWDGRQVVSRGWVADSVKPLISTGDEGEHYGLGWWVETTSAEGEYSSYRADGRGGQYIIAVPSLDLIVVTTGGGFDFDDVAPLLVQAIGDTRRSLPANPAGVAQLHAAVRAVAQAPAPRAVAPLPATARAISGKTFVLAPNSVGLASARLDFDGSATAVMSLAFAGDAQLHIWPVGLDGVYRTSRGSYNAPQGVRGYWADDRTFAFEYAGIANNDHWGYRLRFEGDRVFMQGQETAHELGVTIEGRLRTP
jgi:CubicO group peptidase (beta-lactamase class C family)